MIYKIRQDLHVNPENLVNHVKRLFLTKRFQPELDHVIVCCSGLRIISVANSADPALGNSTLSFSTFTTPLRRKSPLTSRIFFDFAAVSLPLLPSPNVSPSRGSRNVTSSTLPRA